MQINAGYGKTVMSNDCQKNDIIVMFDDHGVPYRLMPSMVTIDGLELEVWTWVLVAPSIGTTVANQLVFPEVDSRNYQGVLDAGIDRAQKKGGMCRVVKYKDVAEYLSEIIPYLGGLSLKSGVQFISQLFPDVAEIFRQM